jgi:hypothetical protein
MIFLPLLLVAMSWRERAQLPQPRAGHIAGVLDWKMVIGGGWSKTRVAPPNLFGALFRTEGCVLRRFA